MFSFLGRLAVAHPIKVCAGWLALAVAVTLLAPDWRNHAQDDDVRFLPAKSASVRGLQLLEKAFPQDVFASRLLFALERPDGPLTKEDFELVDRLAGELTALSKSQPELQITGVVSYREPLMGHRLVSSDKQCTLLQVSLGVPYMATQTRDTVDKAEARLRPILAEAGPTAPKLYATGPAGVGRDLIAASASSLEQTTLATIILVVAVLLLVYRSPVLALIPLVTIGIATWVSLQVLALMTLIPGVQLVNISQVFAIVLIFGAGTDYCLFLIARYREELQGGLGQAPALGRSVQTVSGALVASAATVMVGLGLMGFADFGKIRSAGPVIALGLAVALLASLTLTPALLCLTGKSAFWPRRLRVSESHSHESGFWEFASRKLIRRPLLVWGAALLLLLPFAALGLGVHPTFKPTGDLSPNAPSVRGLDVIHRRFPAGETGPITVLLVSKTDWDTPQGRDAIDSLCRGFPFLGNVAEVRSLTRPLGKPIPELAPEAPLQSTNRFSDLIRTAKNGLNGLASASFKKAATYYTARVDGLEGAEYVTRLDVVLQSDPFSPESIATLEQIETWLKIQRPAGVIRGECYGVTVHSRDTERVVDRDRRRVNSLVLLGVFLILMVLVRKFWLAFYLLATVLLSYFATLGATALFATFWYGKPFGQIEWRVPFFLFTILVAVGEDYNILMVTRAMEERLRWGVVEGLRRGLARTGGTITACGLIMAGTFGTLVLGDLGTLIQIGFALGVGVLLDTFLVRPFLVPALMLVVWKDGLSEEESHVAPAHKAESLESAKSPLAA
jgi:RND superfamily putative drug exporter